MRRAKYTEPLTVAFSPEAYKRIKEISDEKETSMAVVVRETMDKELPKISTDSKEDQSERMEAKP